LAVTLMVLFSKFEPIHFFLQILGTLAGPDAVCPAAAMQCAFRLMMRPDEETHQRNLMMLCDSGSKIEAKIAWFLKTVRSTCPPMLE
jgi:hypothetical protein